MSLGYFPKREPEELHYSVMARARYNLFPTRAYRYAASQMLGSANRTFGGILPNNCARLRKELGPLAELSDDDILDGSAFHLLAPTLSRDTAEAVRQSVFQGRGFGSRNWFPHRNLHYCPVCVRLDESARRPQHWRVLPNYPGISCCDEHRVRLVETNAIPACDILHRAKDWISLDSELQSASQIEIDVAADLRWLHAAKSRFCPGSHALIEACRGQLRQVEPYCQYGWLRPKQIVTDLVDRFGSTIFMVDPALKDEEGDAREHLWTNPPLTRYCLLARLAGTTLEQLFQKATESSESIDCNSVNEALRTISQIVSSRPTATRSEIREAAPYYYDLARKRNPLSLESLLPQRKRHNRHANYNWEARDLELRKRIEDSFGLRKSSFTSVSHLLHSIGLSNGYLWRNKARLPNTVRLIRASIDPQRQPKHHEDWSREFPRPREIRSVDDWMRRDDELHSLILSKVDQIPISARRGISSVLKYFRLNRALLAYAAGQLPKTESAIRELVLPSYKALRAEQAKSTLLAAMAIRPGASRSAISKTAPTASLVLQSLAPEVFEQIMPKCAQGKPSAPWAVRDEEISAKISEKAESLPLKARRTKRTILKSLGVPSYRTILETANGRLPKTEQALAKAVIADWNHVLWEENATRLKQLVAANPGLNRNQVRLLNRALCESMKKQQPAVYEATMPPLARRVVDLRGAT